MKKILLLLSAFLICFSVTACSDNQSSGQADGNNTAPADSVEETEELPMFHGLPEENFNGREFKFLFRSSEEYQFYVDEFTGEIINDKVYERNLAVENQFNIKIVPIPTLGDWDNQNTFMTVLRGSVQAGDSAFDLIDGYSAYIGGAFADNLLLNLNTVDHLRLSSPWWSQFAVEELTINGKLYCVPGDISLNLWKKMIVIFFNKQVAIDFSMDMPYETVLSGNWTYDAYLSMNNQILIDVNGDSVYDHNDMFGSVYSDDLTFDNFHNAFNVKYTQRNSDGSVTLNINTPEAENMYSLIYDLAFKNDSTLYIRGDATNAMAMFKENHVLFMPTTLIEAETLRTMDSDFGIIPYPKLTENQEYYKTTSRDERSMFCIPIDVKDSSFSGLITEALCVASNRIVIPSYYDVVLKGKSARDTESSEMLDIIRAGITFDFVSEYAIQTERAGFILRDCIYYDYNFATYYAQKEKVFNKSFEKFIAVYYE